MLSAIVVDSDELTQSRDSVDELHTFHNSPLKAADPKTSHAKSQQRKGPRRPVHSRLLSENMKW